VRTKFVALILYVIDNFNNCDVFFHIYIIINSIFEFFLNFVVISILVVIVLVQFYVILVGNGMFYFIFYFIKKHQVWLPFFTM
jgi:hypothetical protein